MNDSIKCLPGTPQIGVQTMGYSAYYIIVLIEFASGQVK